MNILQVTREILPETRMGEGEKAEKIVFNKRKMSPYFLLQ